MELFIDSEDARIDSTPVDYVASVLSCIARGGPGGGPAGGPAGGLGKVRWELHESIRWIELS